MNKWSIFLFPPARLWEVQLHAGRPLPLLPGEGGHAGRQGHRRWAEGRRHDSRWCGRVRTELPLGGTQLLGSLPLSWQSADSFLEAAAASCVSDLLSLIRSLPGFICSDWKSLQELQITENIATGNFSPVVKDLYGTLEEIWCHNRILFSSYLFGLR